MLIYYYYYYFLNIIVFIGIINIIIKTKIRSNEAIKDDMRQIFSQIIHVPF